MTRRKFPGVGDVISSSMFAFGERESDKIISIDGEYNITCKCDDEVDDSVNDAIAYQKPEEYNAYDKSRGTAEFVVERSEMEGSGTGHGPHDVYPDGRHIIARRLTKNGRYNPRGEQIEFYMSGAFTHMVDVKDIKILRKMQLTFK